MVEANSRSVSDQHLRAKPAPDAAQIPAQIAGRIVDLLAEQARQRLAAVRSAGASHVGQNRARFAFEHKLGTLNADAQLERAEQGERNSASRKSRHYRKLIDRDYSFALYGAHRNLSL